MALTARPEKRVSEATAAERVASAARQVREWRALVAGLPCILCGTGPVQVFEASHLALPPAPLPPLIPLCARHHRFRVRHGETWAKMYGWDVDLVPDVQRAVKRLLDARTRRAG